MFSENQLTDEINNFSIYFDKLLNVLSSIFSLILCQNYAVMLLCGSSNRMLIRIFKQVRCADLALVIRLGAEIGRGSLDYTVMSFRDAQNARNFLDI